MSDAGRRWTLVAGALLVLIGATAVGIYSGLYNIAADVPHTQPLYWLLETIRERSVEARARDIIVPNDLKDPNRISRGAGQYADMCSGCHLAPGMKRTEISQGLYPRAPELRRTTDLTPAEQFWIVKHGVKMTGMPYRSKRSFKEGTFSKLGKVLPDGAQLRVTNVIIAGD